MKYLVLLLILFSSKINAQNVSFEWHEMNKLKLNRSWNPVFYENDSYFYTISSNQFPNITNEFDETLAENLLVEPSFKKVIYYKNKEVLYSINKYQKIDDKLVMSEEISASTVNSDLDTIIFWSVIEFNKSMYILSTKKIKDSQNKTKILTLQKINDNCKTEGKEIHLDTVSGFKKEATWMKESSFMLGLSEDNSKIIIHSINYEVNGEYSLKIFDSNFQVLNNVNFKVNVDGKDYSYFNVKVTNEGNLAATCYLSESINEKTKPKNPIIVIHSTKDNTLKIYDLGKNNVFLHKLDFKVIPERNELVAAGFYTTKSENKNMQGTFCIRFNLTTGKLLHKNFIKIDDNLMNLFMKKVKSKKEKEDEIWSLFSSDLITKDLEIKNNGNIVLLAERSYNLSEPTDYYGDIRKCYSNDILVIEFSETAELIHCIRIPKIQVSSITRKWISFTYKIEDNNMYFVFNDHKKNADNLYNPQEIKIMSDATKAVAVLVTISNDGKMTRKKLFSPTDQKIVLCANEKTRNNRGSRYIYIYGTLVNKSAHRYGVITLY